MIEGPTRAAGAEGAHVAIDERWLRCAQRRRIQTQFLDLAGAQILYAHVGALDDQALEAAAFFGVAQVYHRRALVAIERLKRGRRAVDEGRPPFARIVAVGLLDLDHFGAQVAQNLPGEGRGDAVSQFDDDKSREGASIRVPTFHRCRLSCGDVVPKATALRALTGMSAVMDRFQ